MKKLRISLHQALISRWMWRIILAIFVISSLWIALSSQYPMAFDEDFHLGIIKLYATQWSPFLRDLPSSAAAFGAIGQDPSYLYHYLMSFPYRFLGLFVHDQATIVILLRILNVAIVTTALVIFRKAFLRAGLGIGSTHVLLAIFALIPISPLLAGQINYDNLLLLLIALLALQIQPLIKAIGERKLPAKEFLVTFLICLTASIVKYAFLPIFAGIILFLGIILFRNFRHNFHRIPKTFTSSWRKIRTSQRILLISLLTLLLILVGQRYVVNAIVYHSPIPNCSKVFSEDACSQYGPWLRDNDLEQQKSAGNAGPDANLFVYSAMWLYGMWYRLFFMISGYQFQNFPPLPIIGFGAALLFIAAITIFAVSWRQVLRGKPVYSLFLLVSVIYTAALWYQNYTAYLRTGAPVAVNGRYLLLILPLVGVPIIAAVSRFFAHRKAMRSFAIACTIIIFFEGGGLSSYIVRSNEHWFWNNSAAQSINKSAKDIISPIIAGSEESLPIPTP